ncbi:MAG: 23S rRNA (pseudouridine(1915)-N(3))-methyltransferase RlmH [Oscillospiraceae bacterium]|nr:23S rRNA (pseudouridine(1915)-N(3))-methyltransferase RlmH [Oscillospiraceae bacterium]
MQRVSIICVGKLKEEYWRNACAEYQKRLSSYCKFSVIEAEEYKLPSSPSHANIEAGLDREGERIIAKIPNGARVITLCVEGTPFSSEQLAKEIADCAVSGASEVCFIIGGSYGLSDAVKRMSHRRISMSAMTFPHQLARVILCEQIYRAFGINADSRYHK